MKRKYVMAVFSVLAVMMMLMSGCSAAGLEQAVEKAVEINQSVSFPDQYSITYQVLNSDGTITTVSKAKDTSGSIYYRSGEVEKLYVCVSSNHFNLYEKDDSGEFKLVSDWEGYTAVYIREETKPFTEYAETSKKKTCQLSEIPVNLRSQAEPATAMKSRPESVTL